MNILLTGASGFIGKHLYTALTNDGHRVIAAVRGQDAFRGRFPGAETVGVDFSRDLEPDCWISRLHGIDAVINAVGIIREQRGQTFDQLHHRAPVALFDACAQAGVRRVIQISALGADASAESLYHLSKRAADNHLRALDLDWTILRPSIVYGPGAHSTAFFRALAALPLTPLVGQGEQPVQPIAIDDLCHGVLCCLRDPRLHGCSVDLVGPEPISLRALLQRQRRWLGLGPLRPLAIPYPLALQCGKAGGFLGNAPITRETIAMLARGNTGDPSGYRAAFGRQPIALEHYLRLHPATTADRWYAGLYFLPYLLRLVIALTWITTGLCSLGLFPPAQSLAILAEAGIEGGIATLCLYGGGAVDLGLGMAMLHTRWLRPVLLLQLLLMALYTALITLLLPSLWIHPFGPVLKNLPLAAATLSLLILARR